MRAIILAILASVALIGCSADAPTDPPAPARTFTAGQVAECQAAEDSFSGGSWMGQELAADVGTADVAGDRATVEGMIVDFLRSASSVKPPSIVASQWTALLAAMRADKPQFAAPMTPTQYKSALDSLWNTMEGFDTPCSAAIEWGQANLPH